MGILDKITRKPEIDRLTSLVEQQSHDLVEADKIVRNAISEVRQLREAKELWQSLGESDFKRQLTDTERNKIREKCIDIYYKTPEGKAIIKNLTNYIVGNGVNYTAQDENPQVQEWLDKFILAPKVRFDRRQKSIVSRTLRDGEVFIHKLIDSKGFTYALRFYPAQEMTEVQTDPNDAEVATKFIRTYRDDKGSQQEETIDASEIQHIKLDVDEDIDRGRPLLENVLKRITQYEDWLNGRVITNKAKSSYFLEKIVDGSPNRVASIASASPSTVKGTFADDAYATQVPRYGTAAIHSKSEEWKFTSPNINADDCKEDGRQIRLSIAAGVQEPEYLLTSDASNNNYASSLVSESPWVKAIEAWRHFFEQEFKILFGGGIQNGIDKGSLPSISTETVMKESARKKLNVFKAMRESAVDGNQSEQFKEQMARVIGDEENYETVDVPTNTEVDFEWPAIITRNLWEETQAVEVWFTNGWISKSTAQMRFGLDPEEEERKIQKEKEENPQETDAYKQMQDEVKKLQDEQAKREQVSPVA